VNNVIRILVALVLAALTVGPVSAATAPSATIAKTIVAQAATSGSVSGTITDANGTPVGNATVRLSGPATYNTTTDATGAFSIASVTPGLYVVSVQKAGFNSAEVDDFAIVAGTESKLTTQISTASFSSIREIARVTARRGTVFNTTTASTAVVTAQQFAEQAQPQVQRVLDQVPGIVIDHPGTSATNASPGAITFPSIRGALGFETASLIDGHPLAVGTFGDYVTTFLNSYALQGAELIKGPGAASPLVNYAIGGTVNFRTKDPTRLPTGSMVLGVNNNGGSFENFQYSGTTSNGRFGWVLNYGEVSQNGPLSNNQQFWDLTSSAVINGHKLGFVTNPAIPAYKTNGIWNNPPYDNTTLLACCFQTSQVYTNRTELAKFRYKLSDATVFTGSYLGSQTWTDQNGNHVYGFMQQFVPGAGYTGTVFPGGRDLTFQNVFAPVGEWEINNEPIFQAEIRTTLHNDTILARYYGASINRLQFNALNDSVSSFQMAQTLYGTGATQIFNGSSQVVTFPANTTYYCLRNNPNQPVNWIAKGTANNNWIPNPAGSGNPTCSYLINGQPVTVAGNPSSGNYFRSAEEDRIHGLSLEWTHPFGTSNANLLTVAYDRNQFRTHSYSFAGDPTGPASIPDGSSQTQGTLLLRANVQFNPKWSGVLANYLNTYQNYVSADGGSTFATTNSSHYDVRAGLLYRPNANISYRAAAGSAIAPPYLFLLSATNSSQPGPPQVGQLFFTNRLSNPNIRPETAFGYDFGADYRWGSDRATTFSWDAYSTTEWNQFITTQQTTCQFYNQITQSCQASGGFPVLPLVTTQNINLTNTRYAGLEAALTTAPTSGWGYRLQGALIRAYPYNLPAGFYGGSCPAAQQPFCTNLAIVSGQNFAGSGTTGSGQFSEFGSSFNSVNNHAIPYAQAYGELSYRWMNGMYASFGEQLYGHNNSLNVPAFWAANATFRLPTYNGWSVQGSVDNLFNAYPNEWITAFAGTSIPLINGQLGLTNQNGLGPRNLKLVFTKSFGPTP
jgi:outer membrane receptor protein involved in Fe transport